MSDQNLNVSITATTAPLQRGMAEAPGVVERATQRMQAAFARLRGETASSMGQTADAVQSSSTRIGAALAGMQRAQSQVGGATAAMATQSKAALGQVATLASSLQAAAIQGGSAWGGLAATMEAQGGRIGSAIGMVTKAALAISAVMSAGLFARMVMGAVEATGKLHDLSQQTGIAAGALAGMASIGKLSDTSLETITGAANKLSVNLSKLDEEGAGAAAALRALGIGFAEFQAMTPDQRMLAVAKAMDDFGDGAGKSAAAVALFGKAGADMIPFLADLADAGEIQAKVTAEQAAAADAFGDNLAKLRASGEAWKKTLSLAMIPALADASQAFLDVFRSSGGLNDQIKALAADGSIDRWTRGAITGLTYVLDVLTVLKRAFQTLGTTIGAGLAQASTMLGGLADAYSKVVSGNFGGAVDSLRSAYGQMTNIGRQWMRDQEETWSAPTLGQKLREGLQKAAGTSGQIRTGRQQLDFRNQADKPTTAAAGKEESRVGMWDAQLAEQKLALAEQARAQGTFNSMSIEQELAYWQQILARTDLSEKERVALRRKAAELGLKADQEAFAERLSDLKAEQDALQQDYQGRIAIAQQVATLTAQKYGAESKEAKRAAAEVAAERRKLADQEAQIERVRLDTVRDAGLAAVELDRIAAQEKVALGQMTQLQLLDQEAQFLERRRALGLADLQAKLGMIDPQRDPVQYAQLLAQIEALEVQHQQRMAEMRSQQARELARPAIEAGDNLRSGFASVFAQIGTQVRTIGDLMRGLGQVIAQTFMQAAAKMAADWLVRNLFMRAISKVTSLSQVSEQAAKAGAGGVASMAAAPFPLNLTAPAFGASMAAAAMAFAPVASAAGGFDIPAGVNPLTQLHAREMVLPAEQAQVIRDMADGGGSAPEPAVELRSYGSVGDWMMVHRGDLGKALDRWNKDRLRR